MLVVWSLAAIPAYGVAWLADQVIGDSYQAALWRYFSGGETGKFFVEAD